MIGPDFYDEDDELLIVVDEDDDTEALTRDEYLELRDD